MENDRWAELKAKQIREKRQKDQTNKETRLLEERLKKESAPRLWQEFITSIDGKIKSFNAALEEEAIVKQRPQNNQIIVGINLLITKIVAEFNFSTQVMRFTLLHADAEYPLGVVGNQVTFVRIPNRGNTIVAVAPSELAQEFLDNIIEELE